MKFRVELWRIVKFLLITVAMNLVFSLINMSFTNALVSSRNASAGVMLSLLSYAYTTLSTLVLTLVHRFFTFRAVEPWFIAAPIMIVCAFLWNWIGSMTLTLSGASINMMPKDFVVWSYTMSFLWIAVSYLLQRCVIYCHTTDQNGWYRRFHPTNEEGVHPYE